MTSVERGPMSAPKRVPGPMDERTGALLMLNGGGLLCLAVVVGWIWFFATLGRVVLWPLPIDIPVAIPGDARAWRMAHMEGITHGLLLIGLAAGGRFLLLTERQFRWLLGSALTSAWLFTVPAVLNALFETRGLAMGGGPFGPSLANDLIYLAGWPPVVAVHVALALLVLGAVRKAKRAA